jgi:hypothetical protein
VFDAIGQANATIYTKLDLTSAYFQLGLDDKSKHKTAFITHALRIHIYWVLRSNLPFLIFEKLNLNVVNEIQNLLTR